MNKKKWAEWWESTGCGIKTSTYDACMSAWEEAESSTGLEISILKNDKYEFNKIITERDKEIRDLKFTLSKTRSSLEASRSNYKRKLESDKELSYNYEKSKIIIGYLEEQNRVLMNKRHQTNKVIDGRYSENT